LKPLLLILATGIAFAQSDAWKTYRDPQGRFEFQYPQQFGATSPGTDDGFGGRTSVRFSEFSAGARRGAIILGGEAALTESARAVDLQAAGGLYDPITLQVFPARIAALVRNALPSLTATTFCSALASQQHLDPADRRLSGLTDQQRQGIPSVDAMGNNTPAVLRCDLVGDTVAFEKTSSFNMSQSSRHIYGAIRFVPKPYATFQVIRGAADAPGAELLGQLEKLVNSWKALR
jgi:hypothetical protein